MSVLINETLAQHSILTNALLRLNDSLIRHNNMAVDSIVDDLSNVFQDLSDKESLIRKSVIDEIGKSGNTFEVADELYNPTTPIFDEEANLYSLYTFGDEIPSTYPLTPIDDSVPSCTAVYRIRFGDEVQAEIKNYHSLKIVDYTTTSLVYPLLTIEDITSSAQCYGGNLFHQGFSEYLDTVAQVYAMSWPTIVTYYQQYQHDDVTSSPLIFGISKDYYLKESSAIDYISSSASILSMSYPSGGIKYTMQAESLGSSASILAMFFALG